MPNAIAQDGQLSIEAKGTLLYLLTRPHNWQVKHGHLMKELRIGRDKFQRVMHELIGAGYAQRDEHQPRGAGNRFLSYNYIISDVASEEVASASEASSPLQGFPQRGFRRRKPDNGKIIRKESTNTQVTNPPSQSPPGAANVAEAQQGATEEELSTFGLRAREVGLIPIFENSEPYKFWLEWRGPDGMPPTDLMVVDGRRRLVVWMPSLYPPKERR